MWRLPFLLTAWSTLSSAAPLDVNETGRVLAELDDWRAIIFALIVLVFLLLSANLWMAGKLVKAVEVIASVREAISSLSDLARAAALDAGHNRAALIDINHHADDTARDVERMKQDISDIKRIAEGGR